MIESIYPKYLSELERQRALRYPKEISSKMNGNREKSGS